MVATKEQRAAYARSYYASNRDAYLASKIVWREKNKEKERERHRLRRSENLISCREKTNEWVRNNPEKAHESRKRIALNLTDAYVACKLEMKVADCPPELLMMKREQILLKRALCELNKTLKEQNGN